MYNIDQHIYNNVQDVCKIQGGVAGSLAFCIYLVYFVLVVRFIQSAVLPPDSPSSITECIISCIYCTCILIHFVYILIYIAICLYILLYVRYVLIYWAERPLEGFKVTVQDRPGPKSKKLITRIHDLFFTKWAHIGVHGLKIGRIGIIFRCASFFVEKFKNYANINK